MIAARPRFRRAAAPWQRIDKGSGGAASDMLWSSIAVFAGGRDVAQSDITGIVRERLVRIIRDII